MKRIWEGKRRGRERIEGENVEWSFMERHTKRNEKREGNSEGREAFEKGKL